LRFANGFNAGLVISFLGSLPLGTVNVAALQLSMTEGYLAASWFALGGLLAESILFILGGRMVSVHYHDKLNMISGVIGAVFFLASILQLYKILSSKKTNHNKSL